MNRIDRLTAILLLLQGGKRTAGEIAHRFEVSRRTILRDIDTLCEMGIPIAADLGASGWLVGCFHRPEREPLGAFHKGLARIAAAGLL
jgi:predicted DNA-binding transcriptional regulator YafY